MVINSETSNSIKNLLFKQVSIAPLASFRILFGAMILFSSIRFVAKGWVDLLYIQPSYHFGYEGFLWLHPLSGIGMYIVYGIMIISALGILLGAFYRIATLLFFLTFTYVELLDKTNYLNHYYFISIASLLMCILPANKYASLDVKLGITSKANFIPNWCILAIQLQIGIVYFFAGIAKINPDWLLEAQPLKIWLKSRDYLPIIGKLFEYDITAYLFSWFGMLFDISIFFFLLNKRTRPYAYAAVVFFHICTGYLFQIGVFPYVMIVATWIFFSADFHQRFLSIFINYKSNENIYYQPKFNRVWVTLLLIHFSIQILLPFRYLLYPGHLFWTEQGYRFSWRVMLMEKNATTEFIIKDKNGKIEAVRNRDFLTPHQEKQMSTQPDMIIQFAHFLANEYNKNKGFEDAAVYVESYAALNGHPSRPFINEKINLAKEPINLLNKKWILPYDEKKN
ncbi:MAG TPA: HTTM domain-containing protein [Chitinophagales bacterium]|nr:HTTM domain-containing protein [Chitinophagales bacterium]HMU98169.1 HTTM domain-containing protein [Chitinophagales bacterium]HMV02565.1 HTTM domain-containing protein [Chitinophagales bacterium]HMW95205.1 HTTM domain-containing protein [Chitinophagales bacterium]HMY42366.1 HTTM domain-containing protein [Chitinophagales bacterium]